MKNSFLKKQRHDGNKSEIANVIYDNFDNMNRAQTFFMMFGKFPNTKLYLYEELKDYGIVSALENKISEKYFNFETFIRIENNMENVSENQTSSHSTFILPNIILTLSVRNITILWCNRESFDELNNLLKVFIDGIKNYDKKDKPIFKLVCNDGHGYYLKVFESKKYDINIDETYNDDFKEVDLDIKNFIDTEKSGLVILHGLQGTGKTTYIRHLMSYTHKDVMYMNADLIANLDSPNFVTFLSEHKNSIIVAEDSEELLKARCSGSGVNNGIVNILNISDGILGDVFNIKFICTFNANLSEIDKALQRKGRLKARYEFKELKADKVKSLSKKYNLGIPDEDIKDMSLSDIFNYESGDFSVKTNKIGLCK